VSPAPSPRILAVVGALAVVYVVWGSTYLGIALAIETMPPLLMASVRFLLAGTLLYVVASRFGDREGDRPGRRQWLWAFLTGVPLLTLGNGSVGIGQETVDSGVASLIIASVPLWIALLDRLFFGRRLSRQAIVGIAVGFGGVALLIGPTGGGGIDAVGALLLVGASLSWAVGSLLARGAVLPQRPLVGVAMQMLAGGSVLAVEGALFGELGEVHPGEISGRSLAGFAFLVFFGSILAFSCYVWLLRSTRTSLVATYAYVNPVVAVLLGWAVLDESIGVRTLVAGGIILAAVALIVSARSEPAPATRESTAPARLRSVGRWSAAWATRGK
jgi:drug/metabolite transporter (DMT)-like permease